MLENVVARHELEVLDGVRGIFARLGLRNETHGCLSEKPATVRTESSRTIDTTTRDVQKPRPAIRATPVDLSPYPLRRSPSARRDSVARPE